jgi:hypothetical protein
VSLLQKFASVFFFITFNANKIKLHRAVSAKLSSCILQIYNHNSGGCYVAELLHIGSKGCTHGYITCHLQPRSTSRLPVLERLPFALGSSHSAEIYDHHCKKKSITEGITKGR